MALINAFCKNKVPTSLYHSESMSVCDPTFNESLKNAMFDSLKLAFKSNTSTVVFKNESKNYVIIIALDYAVIVEYLRFFTRWSTKN